MRCPQCDSEKHVTKRGTAYRKTRWYCETCKRTFGSSTKKNLRCECGLLLRECDGHTRRIDHETPIEIMRTNLPRALEIF